MGALVETVLQILVVAAEAQEVTPVMAGLVEILQLVMLVVDLAEEAVEVEDAVRATKQAVEVVLDYLARGHPEVEGLTLLLTGLEDLQVLMV
jgi:hypothetical protein